MPSTPDPLAWIDEALDDLERRDLRRRLTTRGGAAIRHDRDRRPRARELRFERLPRPRRRRALAIAARRCGSSAKAGAAARARSSAAAAILTPNSNAASPSSKAPKPRSFSLPASPRTRASFPPSSTERDAIFGDAKNHASLIDGCRLSKATRFVYPPQRLRRTRTNASRRQSLPPPADRHRHALQHGRRPRAARRASPSSPMSSTRCCCVDEAHATGVFGPTGRGVLDHNFRLPSQVRSAPGSAGGFLAMDTAPTGSTPGKAGGYRPGPDLTSRPPHPASSHRHIIRVGTLSKALGSGGGFVCGSQSLIDWLANRARTYVFSTAQPPAVGAAAIAALEIVRTEPHRREQLLATAAQLRHELRTQGWNIGRSESQIIPLIIGDAKRTLELGTTCEKPATSSPPSAPQLSPKANPSFG